MGYRIRVLGIQEEQPDLDYLREALRSSNSNAALRTDAEGERGWEQLILTHPNGPEIALIEYNPVIDGELGKDELEEFVSEIEDCKPASAAQWLKVYLPRVKVIYALQLLSGTEIGDGWGAVHTIQGAIWDKSNGILQSDGEGFTNEDGYHILWQFNDNAIGKWNMAVLEQGSWVRFEMDLGDMTQRKEFLEGRLPRTVRRL